eukprot:GHUV01012757.1.p1 GENE.GHUV01012757.1~~GHUV01012757.1.p1  ORF type:complete len:229 (+),score=32.60 GHUV01012757.1:483-1169(+)
MLLSGMLWPTTAIVVSAWTVVSFNGQMTHCPSFLLAGGTEASKDNHAVIYMLNAESPCCPVIEGQQWVLSSPCVCLPCSPNWSLICSLFLQLVKGNTFAGTAFFSYGAFWMAFFVLKYITATSKAMASPAFVSTYLVGQTLIDCLWGVFTFGFFIPTLRKNGCLMTVFGTLWVTFFLLAGGVWNKQCSQAAGYVGFVCGASAIYTAFAEIWHESLGIMMPGLRPVRFI